MSRCRPHAPALIARCRANRAVGDDMLRKSSSELARLFVRDQESCVVSPLAPN
jgi:hypothetical protein